MVAVRRLSPSCGEQGLLSRSGARASHCGGFSCCRVQALGAQASVVTARGLQGMQAQELWHPGLAASWHEGSSQTRARTCVPLHWQVDSQALHHQGWCAHVLIGLLVFVVVVKSSHIFCILSSITQNHLFFFKYLFIWLLCQVLVAIRRIFCSRIRQDNDVRRVGSLNSSLARNQTWGSLRWEYGVLTSGKSSRSSL